MKKFKFAGRCNPSGVENFEGIPESTFQSAIGNFSKKNPEFTSYADVIQNANIVEYDVKKVRDNKVTIKGVVELSDDFAEDTHLNHFLSELAAQFSIYIERNSGVANLSVNTSITPNKF